MGKRASLDSARPPLTDVGEEDVRGLVTAGSGSPDSPHSLTGIMEESYHPIEKKALPPCFFLS